MGAWFWQGARRALAFHVGNSAVAMKSMSHLPSNRIARCGTNKVCLGGSAHPVLSGARFSQVDRTRHGSACSRPMFCSQCGSDIPRGARYCAACGRSQDTKGRIVVPKNAILAVVVVGVALAALSAIIATQSDSPSSAQSEPTARVALVPPTHTVAAAPTPSASPPPQTPTSVPLQVANGTEMLSPENAGLGELTVENGSQRDAI